MSTPNVLPATADYSRRPRWAGERIHQLAAQRESGMTLEALAKLHGITKERVRQLLCGHERRCRAAARIGPRLPEPCANLSVPAAWQSAPVGFAYTHTPATMAAAPKLLTAGQARAQRLIDRIESQTRGVAILEVGALRAMVRNLCAELAAFEPEDGSVEIEFNGERLWVHIPSELIQVNGADISRLLSKADKAAVLTIAEEVQREQRDEAAFRSRYAA